MSRALRVGVDLDGVLYDFAASLRRFMEALGATDIPKGEPETWDFYLDWGLTLTEFIELCNRGAQAGYIFRGPTRPLAAASIKTIKKYGHEVHIITDRQFGMDGPGASHNATHDWLWQHSIPYDSLTFSADKTCVETDVFIEDKLQNYDALEASGCKPFLVNRPWNRDNLAANRCRRRRLGSVAEFAWVITGEWPRG